MVVSTGVPGNRLLRHPIKIVQKSKLDHVFKSHILSKLNIALHRHSLKDIPRQLAELLAIPETELKVERERTTASGKADMVISWGDKIMIIECKASGQADSVAMAARHPPSRLLEARVPLQPGIEPSHRAFPKRKWGILSILDL